MTISITPDAHNWVSQNHTFTATVFRNSGDGNGFVHVGAGVPVTLTLTASNGANPVPAGPFSLTTDANGKVSQTFTSASAGTVVGKASVTQTVNGVPLTRTTGDSYCAPGAPPRSSCH